MRAKPFVASLILCGLFAGCATPQQVQQLQPQSPREALLVANASLTAINNSVAGLYCPDPPACQLGVIPRTVANEMYLKSLHVGKLLDLAKAASDAGDDRLATNQLAMAQQLLLELKRQIAASQPVGVQ